MALFQGESSKFKMPNTSKSHVGENCYPQKFPAIATVWSTRIATNYGKSIAGPLGVNKDTGNVRNQNVTKSH